MGAARVVVETQRNGDRIIQRWKGRRLLLYMSVVPALLLAIVPCLVYLWTRSAGPICFHGEHPIPCYSRCKYIQPLVLSILSLLGRSLANISHLQATGTLGDVLVPALLAAEFRVTCIQRPNSAGVLLPGVLTRVADYSNIAGMTAALQGHDALIEAFNPAAAAYQGLIVKAAIAAGVKHIITPDFSGDTFNTNIDEILIFDVKKRAQQQLEDTIVASSGNLSWTAIVVGPWYDWAIEQGIFWIDRDKRTITRYGSGDQRYSISRIKVTAEALIAVLKNPEKYRNRPAYFASHTITTNKLIAVVESLGLGDWSVVDVSIAGYLEEARRLWHEDTEKGCTDRLSSRAYQMLSTAALLDESNRYGNDLSNKVEPGWDEGESSLRDNLKKLLG